MQIPSPVLLFGRHQVESGAEITSNFILNGQVFFKLGIILDDFVPPAFEVVDERTFAFQVGVAVRIGQEV